MSLKIRRSADTPLHWLGAKRFIADFSAAFPQRFRDLDERLACRVIRRGNHDRHSPVAASKPINVLAMPHALDFNQFRFRDDFINNPVIAQPDAISVFRAAQFFHAVRKWISARFSTASTIRSAVLTDSLRKSLRVDFFHSMRKTIAF
jgi:hypothetical protein